MWATWVALLLCCGAKMGLAQKSPEHDYPALDMAPDSVDDMYSGCQDQMKSKVKEYLPNEKNNDNNFSIAWRKAEKYYNLRYRRSKTPPFPGKEQIMSIYLYTLDRPPVYVDFNHAVRTQRAIYTSSFRYHSLHYFLTDAIQKLSARKSEADRCVTVYRRVDGYFSLDVLNKQIRFGSFTSTSLGTYPKKRYGEKSCFEVVTCFGANISHYSEYELEREVLIPPYEVFKVTAVEKRSDKKSLECEVVYQLKSTDTWRSNLNCKLFS